MFGVGRNSGQSPLLLCVLAVLFASPAVADVSVDIAEGQAWVETSVDLRQTIKDFNTTNGSKDILLSNDISLDVTISIDKPVSIDGRGHTMSSDHKVRLLVISADGKVILNNIVFKNNSTGQVCQAAELSASSTPAWTS